MAVILKLLLKVCTVGSALLLVTAFVGYRAGALGGLIQAKTTAVAASQSPTTESARESRSKPIILGGSKSMVLTPLTDTPGEPRPRPRPTATKFPDKSSYDATAPIKKEAASTPPADK
jgi:hypothetical protein